MAAERIIPLALAGAAPGTGLAEGQLREWGESNGFLCLAETEHEVVYGQAGRFWSPNERAALVSPRTIEEFHGLTDRASRSPP